MSLDSLSSKNEDILTTVLSSKEQSGRVRGLGKGVTPSSYFNKARRTRKKKDRDEEEEEDPSVLHARIRELESELQSLKRDSISERDSCSKMYEKTDEEDEEYNVGEDIVEIPQPIEGRKFRLSAGSITNIVAIRMAFVQQNTTQTSLIVEEGNVMVSIDMLIGEDCLLPLPPSEEISRLSQVLGSTLAWPKNLILLGEGVKIESGKKKKVNRVKNMVEEKKKEKKPPLSVQFLRLRAEHSNVLGSILFTLPFDLFESERGYRLLQEDFIHFCDMEPIAVDCITAYVAYLYTQFIVPHDLGMYKFMDIRDVSVGGGGPQEARAIKLSSRLCTLEAGQIFLVPYNIGGHYVLVVIDPSANIAYFMDSMKNRLCDEVTIVVDMAYKLYHVNEGNKNRKKIAFKVVKSPCQPGVVECGYYVMRFMREIIRSNSTQIIDVMKNMPSTFSQEELDEVRGEWAEFVAVHLD